MIALDTNILAYAAFAAADMRKDRAIEVVARAAATDGILPTQVLVEFGNASLKRRQISADEAQRRVAEWVAVFRTAETRPSDVLTALELVRTARLAYFDALIIAVAAAAGATALLTEDMQDGAAIAGLRVINPFNSANDAAITALLA